MELKDILEEFDVCFNTFCMTGSDNDEDRGNLLIVFGEFIRKLLDDCGIDDVDVRFNPDKCMVDAYSKKIRTLYQFGIMPKSYSLFLDITPPVPSLISAQKELTHTYECLIISGKIRKGWSVEMNTAAIYKEARRIIESLL